MRNMVLTLTLGMLSGWAHAQAPASQGQSNALSVSEHDQMKSAADERQKKLMADADHLLAMAQALKASVDATKKDELSMKVVREAEQIEKLARAVREHTAQ